MLSKIFLFLVCVYVLGCFLVIGGIFHSNDQNRQEVALRKKLEDDREYKKKQEIQKQIEEKNQFVESQISEKRKQYKFPFKITDEFGRVIHYEYNYKLYCKFEYYKNTDKIASAVFSNSDKIFNAYGDGNICFYDAQFDEHGQLEFKRIDIVRDFLDRYKEIF
jgi:hypothetical protein